MNDHSNLFDSAWIDALGWTLLHSLWQGAAIALLLAISLLLLRKKSANFRYLFGAFALSGLLLSMIVTFSFVYAPTLEIEPINVPETTTEIALNQVDNNTINTELYNEADEEISLITVFINYFEEHMPFIMLLYLIGVLILTMRMLGELVYIQNLRHSRSQFVSEVWQQKLKELAYKMGVKTSVALKESLLVNSPMVIGFLKPIVFVPISLLANLPSNQIESILAHELAHIRRHDYLINLLQSFVEILLFFNPSVWWISSFIRSEREHCCDDIAIEMTGDELTFVRTLANLEEWRMQNGRLAVAFSDNRNSGVLKRIQRLLEKKESIQLPFRLFWGGLILTLGLILGAFNINNASALENNLRLENTSDSIQPSENIISSHQDLSVNENIAKKVEMSTLEIAFKSKEEIIENNTEVNPENTLISTDFSKKMDRPHNSDFRAANQVKKDTVPNNIEILEKEMRTLEQSFKQQREELIIQMKEIQSKRYAIEKEVQKQGYQMQKIQLELQREMQNIEKEKMIMERELDLQQNGQEEKIMELQYQIQELELQLEMDYSELSEDESDDNKKKEINAKRKQMQELRKEVLLQEKELGKKELEVKKQEIIKEKEMQEKLYNTQLLEHETQLNAHSKEAELLNLEESMHFIEIKMSELDYELRNNMQQMQQKLENEYEKINSEEY